MKTYAILIIVASLSTAAFAQSGLVKPGQPDADMRAKMLERFDTNDNGSLDPDERQAVRQFAQNNGLAKRGTERRAEMRRRVIAEYDVDGNGQLDDAERAVAREGLREQMMLRRFDFDGDGELSAEEREEAQAEIDARFRERFNAVDTDGDGSIDFEEFKVGLQTLRAQRAEQRSARF